MKHETVAQWLGNVFFWVFAGLSMPAALAAAVFACHGLWEGGNYYFDKFTLPPIDEKKVVWDDEKEYPWNKYREAQGLPPIDPNGNVISHRSKKELSDVKSRLEAANEDISKGALAGVAASLLYAVGRAFRYIVSGA